MKEKVENILNNFLERNKNYAIEVYIRNETTNNLMGQLIIPVDRKVMSKVDNSRRGNHYLVKWSINDVDFSELIIPYDEVLSYYEETDEYGSQTVNVILKCGTSIEFECVGMKI